ncbi:MAG: hypothetical protein R2826_05690 [Thermoleophilia bacterium]
MHLDTGKFLRARRVPRITLPGVLALLVALVCLLAVWLRLFRGFDLEDESGSLVVAWRWALGDVPFVNEENLAQIPAFLVYPFVKVFALIGGADPTGLILYGRHLYLSLSVGSAVVAFFVLRRLVRREAALLIALLCIACIMRNTPQLSSTTMGAALLTIGSLLGLRAILEPPGGPWALASGASLGAAVVAYPTLLFVIPFYGVFIAFALGNQAVAMLSSGQIWRPPPSDGQPTGLTARRVLSMWALGASLVLLPTAAILLSFGIANLERCWDYTLAIGRDLGQLGGATKAQGVAAGIWHFAWLQPWLIVLAVVAFLVYRRSASLGRALLVFLPIALWLYAQHTELGSSGFILLSALIAPYIYVFTPGPRRHTGAQVLIWMWAPSLLAGAMAAYTSSLGYVHAAMGLFPGMLATGLLLAWALEPVTIGSRATPWLELGTLAAIVAVALILQLAQPQLWWSGDTTRFNSGPWWGVAVPSSDHRFVSQVGADLMALAHDDAKLLIFYGGSGLYLYWPGDIAANSYWIRASADGPSTDLPEATLRYYRRRQEVPTIVLHLTDTEGRTAAELTADCGGLDYPVTLIRSGYALHHIPTGETPQDVIARFRY